MKVHTAELGGIEVSIVERINGTYFVEINTAEANLEETPEGPILNIYLNDGHVFLNDPNNGAVS